MQIDNSHTISQLTLRSDLNPKDQSRLPVVIDAKPVFELGEQNRTLPVVVSPSQQQTITTYEQQQAQFVRLFATQAEPSSSKNILPAPVQKLPKGVEQYIQISQLSPLPERQIDEMV